MGYAYQLPAAPPLRAPVAATTELAGEDVALVNGDYVTTSSGDYATVSGDQAAQQSVVREHLANPGAMPRRPDWGVGAADMLFRGNTKANRDTMTSRSQARMAANPRVAEVIGLTTIALANGQGTALQVEYRAVGAPRPTRAVIGPLPKPIGSI